MDSVGKSIEDGFIKLKTCRNVSGTGSADLVRGKITTSQSTDKALGLLQNMILKHYARSRV